MAKGTGIQRRWMTNIVSVILVLVVVCVVVFSIVFSIYYYSNMRSGLEVKAKTTSDFFSNYIIEDYNAFYQSCITYAQTFEDKNIMELQFIDAEGRLVASSYGQWAGESAETSDIVEAITTKEIASYWGKNPQTGERIMAVSSPMIYSNGEVVGVLRYVTSLRTIDRQIILICSITTLFGLLFISFVLFSSKYFIKSILDPVSEITKTARRIAAGSYGEQIKPKYHDEIGELADTINEMSNKISQTEKMQIEFISSLSHELRTPLTAIAGWSETLLATEEMDPDLTRNGIRIIRKESRRLTEMVVELLDFTKMRDGRFTLNIQPSDLKSEFEDTVFMYGNRLKQEGIALTYIESDDEIPEIPCDCSRLRQVYLNLLDNAAKHGGEGKKITAEIKREENTILIQIRDFGPGIPEEELPFVKQKFYKGSSKARGSGIGLAVCDEIIVRHSGTLTLENAQGGGTLVTIRLPIPTQ